MDTTKNEEIAYEMAQLVKWNRQLRDQVFRLERDAKDNQTIINEQSEYIAELKEKLSEKRKEELKEMDIHPGDKIVITSSNSNGYATKQGFVYEVKEIIADYGGDGIHLRVWVLDENGNRKQGIGSVKGLSYQNVQWEKVPDDTPLTYCKKILVKDGRHEWEKKYEFEYFNLMEL